MPSHEQVTYHYEQASKIALELVEHEARRILRQRKSLHEFIMGMGDFFFTRKDGKDVDLYQPDRYDSSWHRVLGGPYPWAEKLVAIFDEWDEYLKLTGTPMRFTATGPVITDW